MKMLIVVAWFLALTLLVVSGVLTVETHVADRVTCAVTGLPDGCSRR